MIVGRFIILALCAVTAYSLPAPQAINQLGGVDNTRTSLTASQVDNILYVLNEIEGIVNIHSARSVSDTGVVNWPVVEAVIAKIEGVLNSAKTRSSLTQAQIDSLWNIANEIEGIINIHSIESRGVINVAGVIDVINQIVGSSSSRSSLTPEQLENILNQIEGIVNIHSARSIPDTGVINWPVVDYVVQKVASILEGLKVRGSLTKTQVDNILKIAKAIEGIINIHSSQVNARSSITPEQAEKILELLNQIEGIINIHSSPIEGQSTVSTASVIDALNTIEGILQIHSAV